MDAVRSFTGTFLLLLFVVVAQTGAGCDDSGPAVGPNGTGATPGNGNGGRGRGVRPVSLDRNGNGLADGVDVNADGSCDVNLRRECRNPLTDRNGDGNPDGIDSDCNGIPDLDIDGLQACLEDAVGPLLRNGRGGNAAEAQQIAEKVRACVEDLLQDLPGVGGLPNLPNVPGLPGGGGIPGLPGPGGGAGFCVPRLLDQNGDGIPDGIDNNCDGGADINLG